MFSLMLEIILLNLLLFIYLLANFPHVFGFSSTFLKEHIAPWPTLHYWMNFKQKQLRLLRPSTQCPCLSRAVIITNRLTARGRAVDRELDCQAEPRLLYCCGPGLARCLAFG